MKNINYILAVFIFIITNNNFAQTYPCGVNRTSTITPSGNIACSGLANGQFSVSNSFIDDFIPKTADQTLTVNICFWIFKPSPGFGYGTWNGANTNDADYLLFHLNNMYSNSLPAGIQIPGVSQTPVNPKIIFARKSFSVIENSTLLNSIYSATLQYNDPNAINIYYGETCYTNGTTTDCGTYVFGVPSKNIFCNKNYASANIGNTGDLIGHELGHTLGLEHNRIAENYTKIDVPESCCGTIFATDYELLSIEDFETISANCGTPGVTNNILSYNYQCQRYLSPRQIGIIHYYLRTSLKDVLTPQSYNYVTTVNPAFDYIVTANETWNYDRFFKGNIVVQPNVRLTVNCLLATTSGAKISVKKQAQMIVDGGTVTNIQGFLWAGIKVHGDPTKDQSINSSTGFANFQGLLRVKNGGTISRSGNAVTNYGLSATNTILWNEIGGIILADDAFFKDNSRDVEFLAYGPAVSVSRFNKTSFKTLNKLNGNAPVFAHVSMWGIKGIQFNGCEFLYAAGNSAYPNGAHGMGIYSIDAGYTIDKRCTGSGTLCATPTVFQNLSIGVKAANLSPLATANIYNSRFIDNWPDAIYMHNMNYSVIDNNNIKTSGITPAGSGMYLFTCKQYNIKNNTFAQNAGFQTDPGIYAFNSQAGAHQIYRNNFSGFFSAINAVNNNSGLSNLTSGLQINCNDFTVGKSKYDVALTGGGQNGNSPTVKYNQGGANANNNAFDLVKNKYFANCGNQNQWYAVANSSKQVLHPSSSNDPSTQPLPQPSCSNPNVQVQLLPIPFTYSVHCPGVQASSGGSGNPPSRLANINQYIGEVQNILGAAFELEAAVAAKTNYYLTDTLLSSRDTVIDILTRNPGHFDDADIQLVFAYLDKGDFSTATTKANALSAQRTDWKLLLLRLINIYQEPDKIYSLLRPENGHKDFMTAYANTEKDGFGIAQALLKFVCGIEYTEPRPLPEGGNGAGRSANALAVVGANEIINLEKQISVFPNPTQTGITLSFSAAAGEMIDVKIEIRDLLGKIIFSNFMDQIDAGFISMLDFSPGVFILTATKNNQMIYKTKVIKQN